MEKINCDIGMVGLGVMGGNLVLNIADHNFAVAVYDRNFQKVLDFSKQAEGRSIYGSKDIDDFISALKKPRLVMMLVPAGEPVDSVIKMVLPFLSPGDIIIDGGNSHYRDTDSRAKSLAERGINFLGVGISGGEKGARFGPSIMPGGPRGAYERVRPIFEAVAAKVDHFACVSYMGGGSAGHYVKMVHNGIEYGLIELIAETYDLMKRGLGISNEQFSRIYGQWNNGKLASFLIEITAIIFRVIDPKTGKNLIDVILDEARQKGTGLWASESAMELQVPVPNIDTAVEARDLSCYKNLRLAVSELLTGPSGLLHADKFALIKDLEEALYAGMIITYSQGFALLSKASEACNYNFDLGQIAAVWRGGCIIRSSILEDIVAAYKRNPQLPHLLEDKQLADKVAAQQANLRSAVLSAVNLGIPVPGIMAALSYYDSLRSPSLPANLIQAQRDYFGSHTYERIDAKGTFHTEWDKS